MRLEELKNDLPETPDFIHNMIQEEVARQTKATNIIPLKKNNKYKWSMGRVAAAAIACIVVTSSVAYAGVKLYHMYLEKQGTYSVETGIKAEDGGDSLKLPKQIHDISITSDYVPEGMEQTEDGKFSYPETPCQGGISISSVLLDKKDLSAAKLEKNVVQSEEHTFGTYDGVYIQYNDLKQDLSFNQRIYLLCPEEYRVITIYFGDDISKEDAIKFAENVVITESDTMIDTDGLLTWSDLVNPEDEESDISVTSGTVPIHQIGDTFMLSSALGKDVKGNFIDTDAITVCVDDVQVADSLDLLKGSIPEEWTSALDESGKLVQNHLSYIKTGDGVESLDTVVDEKTVNQKLVYTTVTYTNTSKEEITDLLYIGTLMTLKQQADGLYAVYVDGEMPGDGYDYYTGDSVARTAEMGYSDVRDGNGKNYISVLKPGESVTINMAWVVNESDINNMYLNLNGTGCSYEFDDAIMENGLVYIGK